VTKHIQSELETGDLRSLQAGAIINQSELDHFGQNKQRHMWNRLRQSSIDLPGKTISLYILVAVLQAQQTEAP
jgi:hypothetical protein